MLIIDINLFLFHTTTKIIKNNVLLEKDFNGLLKCRNTVIETPISSKNNLRKFKFYRFGNTTNLHYPLLSPSLKSYIP